MGSIYINNYGQGGNKISKFPKKNKISKLTYFIRLKKIKNNSKFSQNFKKIFKISKFVYHESHIFLKIGFAEIPYINKGLLSLFNGYGGKLVEIPLSSDDIIYYCQSRRTSERNIYGKKRFASPTLGQHISTFRGYRILFSIRNPYINRFTNHFSIHS